MNTTIRGGAIRKLSATRGYAGGGLLDKIKSAVGIKTDSPELAAYKANAAAERAAAKAPAPAPVQTPTTAIGNYAANTALAEREKAAGLKRGGAIRGPIGAMRAMAQKAVAKPAPPQRKMIDATPKAKPEPKEPPVDQYSETGYKAGGAIRAMAQKKSAEGAKLKGPGTPTSDDIPATVVDTGEPIQVATGERIISKKQDAFLLAQAKADGFTSIDEWLEAGTGQPVGPTVKYSGGAKMAHAAGGMELDPNKGMFTGGDPYAIPGYTPDMIQRAGMGLAGYNPLTQGQTLNVPTNGGNVNADEISDIEKKGFKCGGAIRKMADGGAVGQLVKLPFVSLGYDHSKVQSLGPGLRGAAGGASPEDLQKGDAVDRINALSAATQGGNGPMPTLAQIGAASAPRNVALAAPSTREDLVSQIPTGGAPGAGPTPAQDAVRTGVAPQSPGMVGSLAVTPAAAPAAPATPSNGSGYGGVRPATSPGAIARLSNADGKDVGHGVTRFDVAGKSPLFTNMTDAAGMASNEKLINRGPVSEQNLGALRGIQQRQDIGDLARSQKSQYDAEVAGARAINTAPPVYDPSAGPREINDLTSQTSKLIHNLSTKDRFGRLAPGAEKQLDAIYKQVLGGPQDVHVADQKNRTELDRNEVLREGNRLSADATRYTADSNAGVQRARNATEQEKQAREERKVNAELQQKARIDQLDNLIINGSPLQQKAAAAQKAAIMGKGAESADGKPLNDTQSKALLFGSRMQSANEILDTLAKGGKNFSTPGANGMLGGVINVVNSKEGQQLDQAKRDFINATLRRESGAVISDSEFDNGSKQYFPQIGDAPEVIEQKRNNRILAQRGILSEVPNSDSRVAQVRGTQEQGQPAATASPVDAAAYSALPSGATYTTPSGEVRRKK